MKTYKVWIETWWSRYGPPQVTEFGNSFTLKEVVALATFLTEAPDNFEYYISNSNSASGHLFGEGIEQKCLTATLEAREIP